MKAQRIAEYNYWCAMNPKARTSFKYWLAWRDEQAVKQFN